ncbi:MAG: MBL fold metallo-hydrolase [Bacteroidales bacterium]|nr:MBL fold metallo-hydrolase [Bacteroidales bacterium]
MPMIGCGCEVCRSTDERDKRLRTAALVETGGLTIAIDAGMDFRQQMLRASVRDLDAILMTHNHKDHTGGLDDVRAFNHLHGKVMQIYCEANVLETLKREYRYAFEKVKYPGAPNWNVNLIDARPFALAGPEGKVQIIPIRGMHYKLPVLGFRFGNIAYCTDMNFIPEAEFAKLQGLEHFVISCVRRGHHISHYSLEEAVEVAERVGATHTWLTHLSHQLPRHTDLAAELPPHIQPAYDGLVLTTSY